ncbi:MAG: glycosyltransferase [Planctomycetota bacterium]
MIIDFVITELDVGGAEKNLVTLAKGLQQRGDDVRVFSLWRLPGRDRPHARPSGQAGQDSLVRDLTAAGIPCVGGRGESPLDFPGTLNQLRRWLVRRRGGVCQSFLIHANIASGWLAKRCGKEAWVAGLRVAEPGRFRNRWERRALHRADAVACVSRGVQHFAQHELAVQPDLVTVIPNAVDATPVNSANAFDWSPIGWPKDSEVVLFVGRLHPQKGIDLLQRQIDAIAPSGSKRRLLLVGDGPLRSDLEAWAAKLGPQRACVLGWQADLAPFYRGSRLLVLPSRFEGMPNAVMEAMAAGLPVVCTRTEGIPDLLGDQTPQVVPVDDDASFADRVVSLMECAEHRKRLGDANRQRVLQVFSVDAMVDRYRALYASLLDRTSPR